MNIVCIIPGINITFYCLVLAAPKLLCNVDINNFGTGNGTF